MSDGKKIFKCEAEGDTVYIEATTQAAAQGRLHEVMGPIPANLLTWTEVTALPEGEVFL